MKFMGKYMGQTLTRLRVLGICIVAVIILLPASSLAEPLPDDHLEQIYEDSVHYMIPSLGACVPGQTSGSVTLTGGSREMKAFNYFVSNERLTPAQAAGIVGNLIEESGVMPNRAQNLPGQSGIITIKDISEVTAGRGFGIAQWTIAERQDAWKKFATDKNMDALSLELQLLYLMHELKTNSGYGFEHIKNAGNDARQATWIFLSFFENPRVVIDAGYTASVKQPPAGNSAYTELENRMKNTNSVLKSGGDAGATPIAASDDCSGGVGFSGGTGTPDFKANPNVSVNEAGEGDVICGGDFTAGAQSLARYVEKTWKPPVTSIGGYSCRQIGGSSSWSLHAVGRALDIMIDGTTPVGLATGDKIRNFMINNSTRLGVQRVIWNRHIWSADQDGWRPYSGESPHIDHLHVEINIKASRNANLAGKIAEI